MLFSRVDCVASPRIHWGKLRLGVNLWTKSLVVKVRVSFEFIHIYACYIFDCRYDWTYFVTFMIFSRTDSFPGVPEVRIQWGEHTVLARLWGIQKNQVGPRDDLLCQPDLLRVCPNRSTQTGKWQQAEKKKTGHSFKEFKFNSICYLL